MNLYWIDIKRFFKDHYKLILLLSILFSVLFAGAMFFTKEEPIIEEESLGEENIGLFTEDSKPSYFRFYIEQSDGYTYTNGATIDELFNLDEMYELASKETGVDLFTIKEEIQSQLNETKTRTKDEEEFKPVSVEIDTSSNIFTAIVATGDSTDNLAVANYYYNYLFNEGFELLENNLLYSLEEPQLYESRTVTQNQEQSNENQETENISITDIVIDVIIGLIIGVIISIGIFVLKALFSKKLNYSFAYNTGNPDYFVLYDSKNTTIEFIRQFIELPFNNKKALIFQNTSNDTIKNLIFAGNLSETNLQEYHSLSDRSPSKEIDEIIIVVLSNVTTRKWYNEQIELSKLHRIPVKIIQIN